MVEPATAGRVQVPSASWDAPDWRTRRSDEANRKRPVFRESQPDHEGRVRIDLSPQPEFRRFYPTHARYLGPPTILTPQLTIIQYTSIYHPHGCHLDGLMCPKILVN